MIWKLALRNVMRNRRRSGITVLSIAVGLAALTFLWGFIDGQPQQNALSSLKNAPAETDVSKRISKALKAEGFRFVGPTTIYAFMQSSGMVNDHLVSCPRHAACAKLHAKLKAPGK